MLSSRSLEESWRVFRASDPNLTLSSSSLNNGCLLSEMVDCSIARASSSCRMRLLISAILRCSCSVSARMKLRGLYQVEAKKAWTNAYRVPCPADKMPKRWRMLSLAGFQEELYVAYRKGIYFRSPFDSKNHKELSYRNVTLSAYILHMRVRLERAQYMKLRRRTGEEYAPRSLFSSISLNSSSVICLCVLRLGSTLELSTGMELD